MEIIIAIIIGLIAINILFKVVFPLVGLLSRFLSFLSLGIILVGIFSVSLEVIILGIITWIGFGILAAIFGGSNSQTTYRQNHSSTSDQLQKELDEDFYRRQKEQQEQQQQENARRDQEHWDWERRDAERRRTGF